MLIWALESINANPKNKILVSENIGEINYFFDNSVQV